MSTGKHSLTTIRFQFTHPGRGATTHSQHPREKQEFQFTHPGRGATKVLTLPLMPICSFNSRTPGGVRLVCRLGTVKANRVSIHAPREGCDLGGEHASEVRRRVSVHAPREGCDQRRYPPHYDDLCFNSRTPGGVRLQRRRTIINSVNVSIHAPREGCDIDGVFTVSDFEGFNSRTPGGVRLERDQRIYADYKFQFTHPGRGATSGGMATIPYSVVSIHAPREGCDCFF